MREYKVGDWLKHRHGFKFIEIIDVIVSSDGIRLYTVKWIDENVLHESPFNYAKLNAFFEYSPVAQVLYTNNSNKAVTNETNEE